MTAHLVLGVIGHVDHGKTALVRALTGIETDRLPEERRRGISIALGFAHLTLPGAIIDLIDMPGHERFVRTLVAGATGIDAVLLVVAANEGIKPQTREHLDIAMLLGLRRAVVVIAKADLATPPRIAEVAAEAMALIGRAGIAAPEPIAVSALAGTGLDDLRHALATLAPDIVPRPDNAAPFLPIDRAFSVAGHGTVVTGTLRGGALAVGQELVLLSAQLPARVRGLQVHGRSLTHAAPGQRVAVNLRGIEAASIRPGAALSAPGLLSGATWLSVALRATASAPPLATTTRLRLLVGTQEFEARLRLLDRDTLHPGDTALAQLRCAEPVSAPAREHLILRLASPPLTVAGGRILDRDTARLRRHDPASLARLARLASAAPAELVRLEAEASGPAGTTLVRLAALAGIAPSLAAEMLRDRPVLVLRRGVVVSEAALADIVARIPRTLARAAGGLSPTALTAALPDVAALALEEATSRLAKSGVLKQAAGMIELARPDRDADGAAIARRLAQALRAGGLTPPDPATLAVDAPSRRVLAQLIRAGVAVRATDRVQKRDLLFHRDAIEAARKLLAPRLAEPGLKVTEAGAALGISRKYSVPLLEHLDAIRFTRRIADRRVLGPATDA